MQRRLAIVTTLLAVLAMCIGFAFLTGCLGQSARRINKEHGLSVPASASNFLCGGDAWIPVCPDCGAASAFEIASNDVPAFLAQLKVRDSFKGIREGYGSSIFPGNPQYQIHRPWMTGAPLETFYCASPTGDFLAVQIWRIDAIRIGVCLYTDWN